MRDKIKTFSISNKILYLDEIFVEFEIPLLFTCFDDLDNLYLALCTDSDDLNYLVAETKPEIIIEMLNSDTYLRKPFEVAEKIWMVHSGKTIEEDEVCHIKYEEISEDDLPQANAYYEYMDDEIKEYISKLEKKIGIQIFYIGQDKKFKFLNIVEKTEAFKKSRSIDYFSSKSFKICNCLYKVEEGRFYQEKSL